MPGEPQPSRRRNASSTLVGEARRDQRSRDRRTTERVVPRHVHRPDLRVDRQPDLGESSHGPVEPEAPGSSLTAEGGLEGLVGLVHAEAEDVELAVKQAGCRARSR